MQQLTSSTALTFTPHLNKDSTVESLPLNAAACNGIR